MMVSEMSRPSSAQFRHCFEEEAEALQGHVGRSGGDEAPWATGDVRRWFEQVGIDTDGHEAHRFERYAHVGVDVFDGVLTHDDDSWELCRDLALHLDEAIPTAD